MSTLKVNTLEEATAGGATFYTAKAWVNFNGIGTVAIRDSGNVSSLTDHAVGDYTLTYDTSLASATYEVSATAVGYSGGVDNALKPWGTRAVPTTSAVSVAGFNFSGNFDDIEYAMVSVTL